MFNSSSRSIHFAAMSVMTLAAACAESSNPARPSPLSEKGTTAVTGTESQADVAFSVGAELAAVRQAAKRFYDISAAYAAGYTTEFEPCVAIPGGPAMGVHARNDTLMGDQTVDPLRPELLLYEPTPQLFGQLFDGPMEGHIPDGSMPWHWDLHAWIWRANPHGIFAPFNPTVRCR